MVGYLTDHPRSFLAAYVAAALSVVALAHALGTPGLGVVTLMAGVILAALWHRRWVYTVESCWSPNGWGGLPLFVRHLWLGPRQLLLQRLLCLESVDDVNSEHPTGLPSDALAACMVDHDAWEAQEWDLPALDGQALIEGLRTADRARYRLETNLDRPWLIAGDGPYATDDKLRRFTIWPAPTAGGGFCSWWTMPSASRSAPASRTSTSPRVSRSTS